MLLAAKLAPSRRHRSFGQFVTDATFQFPIGWYRRHIPVPDRSAVSRPTPRGPRRLIPQVDADPKTTALYTCLPEGTDCGTARAPLDVGLTCCSGFHCEASLTLLVTVVGSCKASSPGPDTPGRPTRDAPLANQICKQSAGAPEYKCQCDLPCISAHGNGQKKCDDCYPLLTDGSPCPFDAYSAKHDACAFNG